MKKRVLTVSLSLLVCLCCCFSGFGSVNAFAQSLTIDTTTFYLYQDELQLYSFDNGFNINTGEINLNSAKYSYSLNVSDQYVYKFGYNDTTSGLVSFFINPWDFPYLPDLYDYYFVCGQYSENNDFLADKIYLYVRENGVDIPLYAPSFDVDKINSSVKTGYTYTFKLEDFDYSSISALGLFDGSDAGIWPNIYTWYIVVPILKGTSSEEIESIISAINNQTTTLDGSIGQAAEDIQQSIEDQYQMEDEEDFGFSDIQQQYEEKMGVLTFGTETTLQMLDLFSPSNAGEAYIRVPGWSMDVQGETYQIWDEYVFYFDSIEENFPFLVTTMRTFTVAMFYIAIVSYINKVYERNFLAK